MNSPHSAKYIWQQPGWPALRYDLATLAPELSAARRAQGTVLGLAEAVGLEQLAGITNAIWVDEIIATAAIEGEALNLDAVRSSVARKLGLDEGGPVARNVDGLVDVMHDAGSAFADRLDADRLCRWHSALFPGGTSGIRRIEVGRYRPFSDPMQIISGRSGKEVIRYEAPPSLRVAADMDAFIDWFNTLRNAGEDGLIRTALAHLWFETIHPFEDGNGRIGRAIVDLALAQDLGAATRLYSMSRQLRENRRAYYDALNQAQSGALDVTDWVAWFVRQFALACEKSGQIIQAAIAKQRFWAQHASVPLNERQRKAIQKLLDVGDSGFQGGLSAEKYSAITGASKATATRDLTALAEHGLLAVSGQGRATRYALSRA
jgi:Fic family protein